MCSERGFFEDTRKPVLCPMFSIETFLDEKGRLVPVVRQSFNVGYFSAHFQASALVSVTQRRRRILKERVVL